MKTIYLKEHGPFYKYLIAYQSIGVSLISLMVKENRLAYEENGVISYGSKTNSNIVQHINEIVKKYDEKLSQDEISDSLANMFINICYESVKEYNDKTPEFEFFRHIRNAASHGNKFHFTQKEPYRKASWNGIVIDHNNKGETNVLHGKKCIGNIIGSADIFYLLHDIENKIPKSFYSCEICKESNKHNA